MNPIYVFPGQGSQHVGMGKGLFGKYPELIAQVDEVLGYSLEELCIKDPNGVLNQTQYTQPALYTVNVLTYIDKVANGGANSDYLAGHSLGEYCALHIAGAFDFATGLMLVKKRGELMSRAPKGAMLAVLGIDQDEIARILNDLPYENIDIANMNSRYQSILSGIYEELTAADVQEAFTNAGGMVIPLNVSAVFHSHCMKGVESEFEQYVKNFELAPLQMPVVANYTARPYPKTDYSTYMTRQISHPVRWYESISWLISKGYTHFEESGPGNVLTKLCAKISADPMSIVEPAEPREEPPVVLQADEHADVGKKLIFMFAGQGSQYYQMGRELYDTNAVFRKHMDHCNREFQSLVGTPLLEVLYGNSRKGTEFDDILYTHPALFSIGYSLAQVLIEDGMSPWAVVGHSLGEYVAAVISGMLSVNDAIDLVTKQARLLKSLPSDSGLLSVLGSVGMFHGRPDLFEHVTLGGVNYSGNFFVSGNGAQLSRVHGLLNDEGVISVILPVRYGFHSGKIDPIKSDFLTYASRASVSEATMPVFSSALATQLDASVCSDFGSYLWNVVRGEVKFAQLISGVLPSGDDYYYVDLSASSIFSTFFKYGGGGKFNCTYAINPFGNNLVSMGELRDRLCIEQA